MDSSASGARPRLSLTFRFRGRNVALDRFSPRATLLDWLREEARRHGHQGRLRRGRLRRLHGRACAPARRRAAPTSRSTPASCCSASWTARSCSRSRTSPRARRCIRCSRRWSTPRLAMRLLHAGLRDEPVRALPRAARPRRATSVDDALAGNLCRCTGYRPILDAALGDLRRRAGRPLRARRPRARRARSQRSPTARDLFVGDEARFFAAPASEASLAALYAAHPRRRCSLAGATDVGLWVTKQLRDLPQDDLARPRRRARRDRARRRTALAHRRRRDARSTPAPRSPRSIPTSAS